MKHLSNLKFMAMALFVAMLSLSFTACSDDDDDEGGSPSKSIVGTWVQESVDEYEEYGQTVIETSTTTFVFKANNKGERTFETLCEYEDDGPSLDVDGPTSFSYSYDSETRELIIMYSDYIERYTATVMNDRLLLEDKNGYNFDFKRK